MAVDASWDFASDANAYFEASIILGTSTGGAFDRIRKSTSQGDAAGSMTNYLLSAIFSYTGAVGETADLSWYMESSLAGFSPYTPGLTATIDARNTGTIFYRTTGSLQASSSGSTFLTLDVFTSDAGHLLPGAGPSPVPLPAGGGLLLLGIACLAVGRRRRQRARGPESTHTDIDQGKTYQNPVTPPTGRWTIRPVVPERQALYHSASGLLQRTHSGGSHSRWDAFTGSKPAFS